MPFALLAVEVAGMSSTVIRRSFLDVGLQEIQKVVGLQVCIASLVIATLSTSYNNLPSALSRHLRSIGAKIYGAFWCSHCQEQKQMFGVEAAKLLDYIECFPDGFKTGNKMIKACADAKLEGFPTWVINGQVISGEMELRELAEVSRLNFNE